MSPPGDRVSGQGTTPGATRHFTTVNCHQRGPRLRAFCPRYATHCTCLWRPISALNSYLYIVSFRFNNIPGHNVKMRIGLTSKQSLRNVLTSIRQN